MKESQTVTDSVIDDMSALLRACWPGTPDKFGSFLRKRHGAASERLWRALPAFLASHLFSESQMDRFMAAMGIPIFLEDFQQQLQLHLIMSQQPLRLPVPAPR